MMKTYFDNATLETRGNFLKVELEEEECTIMVKKTVVQKIFGNTGVEEAFIALLLAYIEYVRKTRNSFDRRNPRRVKDETIIISVSKLLNSKPTESLIERFRGFKWHEICQVLEASDPVEAVEEI